MHLVRAEGALDRQAIDQRVRLGLAVTDDAGDDQVGVVEHGAERMAERVASSPPS
jgi:hypothetical protein